MVDVEDTMKRGTEETLRLVNKAPELDDIVIVATLGRVRLEVRRGALRVDEVPF